MGIPISFIGSLTPNDGGLYCTCESCELQNADLPTRLVEFMNETMARLPGARMTAPHPFLGKLTHEQWADVRRGSACRSD